MKKLSKSILALAMATAMLAPSVAKAADETAPAQAPAKLTKTLEIKDNAVLQNTVFNFSLVPAKAAEGEELVSEGVEGLLSVDTEMSYTNGELENGGVLEFTVDKTKAIPGVYKYTLSEVAGDIDGMIYSDVSYTLYLYLYNDGTYSLVAYNKDKVKGDAAFVNDYSENLKTLTVEKKLDGNMADSDKAFTFNITLGGDNDVFKYKDVDGTIKDAVKGEEFEVQLKGGQSIEIYGLSAKDTYKVDEDDYSSDGYVTEGEVVKATEMGTEDKTVTVINKYDKEIPTGVVEKVAPFAILIVAAGATAKIYFNKKQYEA